MGASSGLRAWSPRRGARAAHAVLARLAVAGASGDGEAVGRAARAARRAGLTRRAVEETALMLVLYAGYPAALETLRVVNAVWPGRARRAREGGVATWRRRGTALSRRVYGPVHRRLIEAVRGLHPDLAVWMVEEGYGRVLSRRGLAFGVREEITVAVLAALGRERQLVSHLFGAARAGVRVGAIRHALVAGATARLAVPAARSAARRAWRSAFPGRR